MSGYATYVPTLAERYPFLAGRPVSFQDISFCQRVGHAHRYENGIQVRTCPRCGATNI